MKTITGIFIAATVVFLACEKDDSANDESVDFKSVEGKYLGTQTYSMDTSDMFDAQCDINMMNDSVIEVHCYGELLDTTIMLQMYENQDSIMVCFTDSAFYNAYGHMNGHMGGHMHAGMGGMHGNFNSEWLHHLNDEHDAGDMHYGGFDMMNHSFEFEFKMQDGFIKFQGYKE